jgi:hypothetical protein
MTDFCDSLAGADLEDYGRPEDPHQHAIPASAEMTNGVVPPSRAAFRDSRVQGLPKRSAGQAFQLPHVRRRLRKPARRNADTSSTAKVSPDLKAGASAAAGVLLAVAVAVGGLGVLVAVGSAGGVFDRVGVAVGAPSECSSLCFPPLPYPSA